MELILVRHAEPAWSVGGLSQVDPELTSRGAEQADLTAQRLATDERGVDEVIVSPARRAVQTALPLSELTGRNLHVVDDLVEIRMPDWSGQLEETVQQIFAEARHRKPEEWWDGLPGGESFRDFHNRVTGTVTGVLAERGVTPDGRPHLWEVAGAHRRVVIVGHGGTNAVALGFLLGLEPTPWEWERFILGHGSLARVRAIPLAGAHVFSLRAFNDREHLPPDLRTR